MFGSTLMAVAGVSSLAIAFGGSTAPFTPTSGDGSTYVFSQLGPWNDPVCQESNSVDYGLKEMLDGLHDEVLCYAAEGFSGSACTASTAFSETGLTFTIDSEGLIYDKKDIGAFSRHDYDGLFVFDSFEERRVRINLMMEASGLGSLVISMRRIGDAGGGGGGSQLIVNEALNAYIDFITFDETWVMRISQGRWRVAFYTTHQCMSSTEGFEASTADLMYGVTVIAMGDVDGNGTVNTTDLLAVIGTWGDCDDCLEDLDGDGVVGVNDLLMVIGEW